MGKNGNMWPFQVPQQIANEENTDQSEVTWCMNFFETKKRKIDRKRMEKKEATTKHKKIFLS